MSLKELLKANNASLVSRCPLIAVIFTLVHLRPSSRLARGLFQRACVAIALLVVLAPATAPAQVVAKELPAAVRGLEVTNHLGQQVPLHLQFKNEQGELVSLEKYFNRKSAAGVSGKPVIVQMMYYRCPLLCPEVLKRLTNTLNQVDFTVGKDFDVLLVSVDPTDTPLAGAEHKAAQLVAYNRSGDAVIQGWNFLTSSGDSARQLADAIGFPYRYLPASNEFSHGAALFVLTPEGKVSRYLLGLNYPATDVRLALLEASGGKIGTVFDSFTLWCYHFDPEAGTYKFAMGVMRTGSLLTLLFIGALLMAMWRFEHRRKAAASTQSVPSSADPQALEVVQIPSGVFGPPLSSPSRAHPAIAAASPISLASTARSAEFTGPKP
jgi:protein SCO1